MSQLSTWQIVSGIEKVVVHVTVTGNQLQSNT